MDPHLTHKLPWASLGDVIKLKRYSKPPVRRHNVLLGLKEIKVVYHFARCFTAAIKEFAASDTSTAEERRTHDPTTWGLNPFSRPYDPGYYDSLIQGYIDLNLFLMDPQAFPYKWEDEMSEWYEYGCPEWLAQHLRQAFDRQVTMKPLTAEVLQILRDHCAKLFRCLYSISGDNRATEPDVVLNWIAGLFGFHQDVYLCREADPSAFSQQ